MSGIRRPVKYISERRINTVIDVKEYTSPISETEHVYSFTFLRKPIYVTTNKNIFSKCFLNTCCCS